MNNRRERIFFICFFGFLFLIFLNFGIHIYRTVLFNQKTRTITSTEKTDGCGFDIHFRGGASDSWIKVDSPWNGHVTTLKGTIFEGAFTNSSIYQVVDWKLRININEDCAINNSWCGTVEIHQKDKVQTLDLRNFNKQNVTLDSFSIGQDFMIPLHKGDYIIYNPSIADSENLVHPFNGADGFVSTGFIFYYEDVNDFKLNDYCVDFKFQKGYFQGTEPLIFVIMLTLWFVVLIIKITVRTVYKKAKLDADRALNVQRMEDMKSYNAKLNADVESKTAHIKDIQQKVVIGLANVIGNRDPDTGGHVKRTSDIIKIIVEEFRKQNPDALSDEKASDICRAAPMHDLGKIYIESSILCKPGKLTDEEYAVMKKHSENSGEIVKLILKDVEEPHFVETAFNVARHHHERWDGRGYPDQLSGEAIPLEARIMAVADVYDALVSRRCYKQSMSFEKAYEIMVEGMGSQFAPEMKAVFIACHEKLEEYYTVSE